ncbi:MAG: hypothetical protein BGO57_12925 [Sphingomonadales bacterium 63-6]|nr:MAG: hypothetical protein BGO57_12925 [Sphingomonadales bacterium 63-6]
MKTYFVSFRIADRGDNGPIYENLHKAVEELAGKGPWWFETTSFYLFNSELSAVRIAECLKKIIRPSMDILVVGSLTHKVGAVVGKCDDDDIFTLADFMKKV